MQRPVGLAGDAADLYDLPLYGHLLSVDGLECSHLAVVM